MTTTCPNTSLSPSLRHALRVFAQWVEGRGDGQCGAFAARAAIRPLAAVDRARLARWLAWTGHALASQGRTDLTARLQRLDAHLHGEVRQAGRQLPGGSMAALGMEHVRRARGARPVMTFVTGRR